jgi:predicted nucleic acid-binding Zn ribbon protein
MPTYEFRYEKCGKVFELSYSVTEYERSKKKGIKCARFGSSRVAQQISGFQVNTTKKKLGASAY